MIWWQILLVFMLIEALLSFRLLVVSAWRSAKYGVPGRADDAIVGISISTTVAVAVALHIFG